MEGFWSFLDGFFEDEKEEVDNARKQFRAYRRSIRRDIRHLGKVSFSFECLERSLRELRKDEKKSIQEMKKAAAKGYNNFVRITAGTIAKSRRHQNRLEASIGNVIYSLFEIIV